MEAVIYSKATGEIFSLITGNAAELSSYGTAERGVLEVAAGSVPAVDAYWVNNGAVVPAVEVNPTISTTVAKTGEQVTIGGLPTPCWIVNSNVGETPIQVTTGSYTFSCSTEKRVTIRLQGQYVGEATVRFANFDWSKDKAKAEVDAAAEAARSRVVTPGSGQAMTYLRKADAAIAFLNGETLSAPQTQRLEDEAARLGVTVEAAAEALAATANAWEMLDASIDDIRLTAKQAIDAATTGTAIDAVLRGINWPV